MSLHGWGNYPVIKNKVIEYDNNRQIKSIINSSSCIIAHGNGRSYGDSAINDTIIHIRPHNYFISFDYERGLLHVQAGVLLSEIVECFVPKGWFLKVTPGTKFITIGGAIASDVHGKNHHIAGCFSDHLNEFEIMIASGEIINCSKNNHPELFKATCGGMGLTGIILSAKIYLKSINSQFIDQKTIKNDNLKATFDAFEKYQNVPYSVAWIDCLSKGNRLGRSLLMIGDFIDDGRLDYKTESKINIPFNMPPMTLSRWNVRLFNELYYSKAKNQSTKKIVKIDKFFYPLDVIDNWNRIYGKGGFVQYQFVLPKKSSYEGLKEILKIIADSGQGSFLAVLKLHGKSNSNYLSFPIEGYSLALDFKMGKGTLKLLSKLDNIILKYNGRIYLTKDSRVTKEVFEQGYPQVEIFRQYRKDNGMDKVFQSYQSQRVGI